jgi:hypothetical protein
MAVWKGWWEKAVAFVLEPSRHVCTICGGKVAEACVCEACGVTACAACAQEGSCPYCGEPL